MESISFDASTVQTVGKPEQTEMVSISKGGTLIITVVTTVTIGGL